MKPDFYQEIIYWKKYLEFLPLKYQERYTIPDETFWQWKNENIHLDFKAKADNTASVILIHGAGGNGRILSLFGSHLFANGINYYAPDNLGYGLTKLSSNTFEYQDWVAMLSAFTNYIIQKDGNPVILIGMSIGGMLAYQVAAKVDQVAGVIVTTLADPRDKATIIAMSRTKFLGTFGLRMIQSFSRITDKWRLPIRWLCKLHLMSRDPYFSRVFMKDQYAGGVKISMKFLRTFVNYKPETTFEEFDTCPILLLHPEKDEWTPFSLSKKVFDRLQCPKEFFLLKNCGHAPIEEPGVYDLEKYMLDFIKKRIS